MGALELSFRYFRQLQPKLQEAFPDLYPRMAVGMAGNGSECFGYDDSLSEDHDFEPGFCIFLPDESIVDSRTAFRLERAYSKLPREFCGYRRSNSRKKGKVNLYDKENINTTYSHHSR